MMMKKNMFVYGLAIVVFCGYLTTNAAPAGEQINGVKISSPMRAMLEEILNEDQMEAAFGTLSHEDAWGSLGPSPAGEPEPLPFEQPEKRVELDIPEDAQGSGTASDPWVNVISAYLDSFEYSPAHIESFDGTPRKGVTVDDQRIDDYMETIDYEPRTVVLPEGYYVETMSGYKHPAREIYWRYDGSINEEGYWNVGFRVPPGIWLEGADELGDVVIRPAMDEERPGGVLAFLDIRSALVNVALDGGGVGPWEVGPSPRANAVQLAHHAVLSSNHIHHFNGAGIVAYGARRGQAGTGVVMSGNIMEYIGQSGVHPTSGWLIRDNQIRYGGILSTTGGGGNDVIIPRHGRDGEIVNNLIIGRRMPRGRHVIGHQEQYGSLVAGNVVIAENGIRNTISASDGAHMHHYVGNLSMNLGEPGRSAQAGLTINGYGGVIEYNASFGNPSGFRAAGREDKPKCIIRYNYAEYTHTCIHGWGNGRYRENYENTCKEIEELLPVVESADFGFFRGMGHSPPHRRLQ